LGEDPVCSLIAAISYPCGGDVTKIKVAAVKRAIADGVDEVEVCAPVFALREGNYAYFKKECKKLKKAAKGRALRIVIDWATLNDSQIGRVCAIAADCGVDMIRFSNMGDYSLISSVAGALKDKCLIKVDGAASYAQFQQGIVKGASVVGCVGGVEIAQTVMNLANNG
jgi:deoxyribose-phosphate aldolase